MIEIVSLKFKSLKNAYTQKWTKSLISLTLKGYGLSVDRFVREGTNDSSDSLDFNIPKTYRVVMTRETKMTATSG